MKTKQIYVSHIEYQLPEQIITNDDLKKLNPDWNMELVASKTGVLSRRFVKEGELVSDLAFKCVTRLLEKTNILKEEIDALIFCTQSPDYIMPPNSSLLHAQLDLPTHVACFDMTLACSGYIYGLAIAKSMMASLGYKKVLLITGDTYSKYMNPRDRSTITLFGDGVAVSLLEQSTRKESQIIDFALATNGHGGNKVVITAGGLRVPKSSSTCKTTLDIAGNARSMENIQMNGRAILELIETDVINSIRTFIKDQQLTLADLELVLFHQASRYVLERLCTQLEIQPEKTFSNIAHIGNTVSASIPILIKDAISENRLKRGDKILLVGFGAGFSWGCCLMKW